MAPRAGSMYRTLSAEWLAVLVSTSLMTAIAIISSSLAPRGSSQIGITIPLGLVLMLVLGSLGLLAIQQLRAARMKLTFRPASLVVAQACVILVVVSIQHLGYLGLLVCLLAAPAGAVALAISWTHASDGRGVGVGVVAVGVLVLGSWFAGRADERPIEGLVAVVGTASCLVLLYLSRARQLGRE